MPNVANTIHFYGDQLINSNFTHTHTHISYLKCLQIIIHHYCIETRSWVLIQRKSAD